MFIFMNPRLKYGIIAIILGCITFVMVKLVKLTTYPGILNLLLTVLILVTGFVTILMIIKVVAPKLRISRILWSILNSPF
jgi:hypothetical protein